MRVFANTYASRVCSQKFTALQHWIQWPCVYLINPLETERLCRFHRSSRDLERSEVNLISTIPDERVKHSGRFSHLIKGFRASRGRSHKVTPVHHVNMKYASTESVVRVVLTDVPDLNRSKVTRNQRTPLISGGESIMRDRFPPPGRYRCGEGRRGRVRDGGNE